MSLTVKTQYRQYESIFMQIFTDISLHAVFLLQEFHTYELRFFIIQEFYLCCHRYTERIAWILCMQQVACRFFQHPTALIHLKKLILSKCIQLNFIFLAHTPMGSQ